MQSTTVISLSWREGGPELLAQCTAPAEDRPALLSKLATELCAKEVLYLVTCNRVEVAFRRQDPMSADKARRAVLSAIAPAKGMDPRSWRAWTGEGAVEHLFLVAAGLASAKVGETEIAGQLRAALEMSRALGLSGGRLAEFVEEALRTARKIRKETALAEGKTSLAEIALERLQRHSEGKTDPLEVALIGNSPMTQRCARALSLGAVQLHWVNRTPLNIQPHADEVGATVHSLESFRENPPRTDAVVTATGSSDPILNKQAIKRLAESGVSLIIDMAVSPDIQGVDASSLGIEHISLLEILEHADRTKSDKDVAAADARVLVDEALEVLGSRHRAKSAEVAASKLHETFRRQAAAAAGLALEKEFKHFSEEDAVRLRRFTDLLARQLAHTPSKGLRRLAADHGPSAADNFMEEPSPMEES